MNDDNNNNEEEEEGCSCFVVVALLQPQFLVIDQSIDPYAGWKDERSLILSGRRESMDGAGSSTGTVPPYCTIQQVRWYLWRSSA